MPVDVTTESKTTKAFLTIEGKKCCIFCGNVVEEEKETDRKEK